MLVQSGSREQGRPECNNYHTFISSLRASNNLFRMGIPAPARRCQKAELKTSFVHFLWAMYRFAKLCINPQYTQCARLFHGVVKRRLNSNNKQLYNQPS
jgi:hypothetical protein